MCPARLLTAMFDRFGIERRDLRNLLVVAVVVGVVMAATTDPPLEARVAVAVVGGAVSAVTFLLATILINAVRPDRP